MDDENSEVKEKNAEKKYPNDDDEDRRPLIEPLQNVNEYINTIFPMIVIIALAIIAALLAWCPQVFNYIFSNSAQPATSIVTTIPA